MPESDHILILGASVRAAAFSALALVLAALLLKESLPAERRAEAARNRPGRIAQIRDAFERPNLRRLMILFFTTTFAFAGMETTFALWALHRPRSLDDILKFTYVSRPVVSVKQFERLARNVRELLPGFFA